MKLGLWSTKPSPVLILPFVIDIVSVGIDIRASKTFYLGSLTVYMYIYTLYNYEMAIYVSVYQNSVTYNCRFNVTTTWK